MTAFDSLLAALENAGRQVKRTGDHKASAQCPAHDDGNPSLSVTGIEGQALIYCHAQCPTDAVLAALHLDKADLFDDRKGATYRYDDGRTVHRTPDKRFKQSGNTKGRPTLYRLERVKEAIRDGRTVYLVEGEKDVHALEAVGGIATTAPMGGRNVIKADLTPLHNGNLIAIVDRDETGDAWASALHAALDGQVRTLDFKRAAAGKDAADHIAADLGPSDLADYGPEPDAEEETATERARRLYPRTDWHALWADDTDDEWVSYPLLPAGRLVALYSAPKVGKSLLMLEMALKLSRGMPFLGHVPDRRFRVLYVDYENDPRGDVRTRLESMNVGPDDLDWLDHLSFPTMASLDSAMGGVELVEAVKAYGSDVVVIDTVSRAIEGEENSNDTWLNLYRNTGLLLKQLHVAMIRLDHSGKDKDKGMRGGSAKYGDVDAVWKLTTVVDDQRYKLECTDARMRIDDKSLHLVRRENPLRHDAENISHQTERERRIAQIIKAADDAGLPDDASYTAVRSAIGLEIRKTTYGDAIRRRKARATAAAKETFSPVTHITTTGRGDGSHGSQNPEPRSHSKYQGSRHSGEFCGSHGSQIPGTAPEPEAAKNGSRPSGTTSYPQPENPRHSGKSDGSRTLRNHREPPPEPNGSRAPHSVGGGAGNRPTPHCAVCGFPMSDPEPDQTTHPSCQGAS